MPSAAKSQRHEIRKSKKFTPLTFVFFVRADKFRKDSAPALIF